MVVKSRNIGIAAFESEVRHVSKRLLLFLKRVKQWTKTFATAIERLVTSMSKNHIVFL
jgi:hypothetical protein